jgi:hypothetical protein
LLAFLFLACLGQRMPSSLPSSMPMQFIEIS